MSLPYVTAGQAEKISREVAQEEIGKAPTPSGGTKLYKHELAGTMIISDSETNCLITLFSNDERNMATLRFTNFYAIGTITIINSVNNKTYIALDSRVDISMSINFYAVVSQSDLSTVGSLSLSNVTDTVTEL